MAPHTCPDLDSIAAIYFLFEGQPSVAERHTFLFLKDGDEFLSNSIENIICIDRGRGEFDHHGKNSHWRGSENETSASKVAKKYGLTDDLVIQQFLKYVEANDLKGFAQPYDVGDLTKKIAHSAMVDDEQRMEMGLRIIGSIMEFRRSGLERDKIFTRNLIQNFAKKNGFECTRLQGYCKSIGDSKLATDYDLAEILTGDKKLRGENETRKFGEKILKIIQEDKINFKRALKKIKKVRPIRVSESILIRSGFSNNPAFNRAARYTGATVVIQQSSLGVQIYFNFRKIKKEWIDNIVAALRLEEQVIRNGKPLLTDFGDLKEPGRVEIIPEWYYYVSGDPKGGRFILNRSLTAPSANVPKTKISPDRIVGITKFVLKLGDRFNFSQYVENRLKYRHYKSRKKKPRKRSLKQF